VHDVVPIFLQIALGGLLDVKDAAEAGRGRLAHLAHELQEVADVGTSLIEVEQILPVGHTA
jgi:hypothetical protein